MNQISKDIRAITIILAVLIFLMTVLFGLVIISAVYDETPAHTSCRSGDVNQDGVVSQADLDLMQDYLLHIKLPTIAQLQASDINGDGRLNSCDLTLLSIQIEGGNL